MGSIRVKGSYIVALYSQDSGESGYCQTFTQNVENLRTEPILASGTADSGTSGGLNSVYIIPVK